jgi:hypothetical protein
LRSASFRSQSCPQCRSVAPCRSRSVLFIRMDISSPPRACSLGVPGEETRTAKAAVRATCLLLARSRRVSGQREHPRGGADSVLWSLRSPEGTCRVMSQGRCGGLWAAPPGHRRPQTPRSAPARHHCKPASTHFSDTTDDYYIGRIGNLFAKVSMRESISFALSRFQQWPLRSSSQLCSDCTLDTLSVSYDCHLDAA